MPGGALAGFRVVECGDMVPASYAAKMIADMGAEVIKVEHPGRGDEARRRGPYPGKIPHPEKSGLFLYLNTNKRGVTLNLETSRGQDIFQRLVGQADLFIHNVHPTRMAALGLDYESLASKNKELVMTSITPFGLTGPHKDYQAYDLNSWSAGGLTYLNGGGPGTEDLPPLKVFGQQSGFQAGVHAAVASLGALFARLRDGVGQHVDFSTQECLMAISEFAGIMPAYAKQVVVRFTGNKAIRPLDIMECKDGWIYICCVEEHQWKGFVDIMGNPEWADESLFATRLDRAENWDALELFHGTVGEGTNCRRAVSQSASATHPVRTSFRPWGICSTLNTSKLGGFSLKSLTPLPARFPIPPLRRNSRPRRGRFVVLRHAWGNIIPTFTVSWVSTKKNSNN
jgi:crotonobetainyl-CoA:carnitine CoA-transferase CaiB-like acyl-CoA transferase